MLLFAIWWSFFTVFLPAVKYFMLIARTYLETLFFQWHNSALLPLILTSSFENCYKTLVLSLCLLFLLIAFIFFSNACSFFLTRWPSDSWKRILVTWEREKKQAFPGVLLSYFLIIRRNIVFCFYVWPRMVNYVV